MTTDDIKITMYNQLKSIRKLLLNFNKLGIQQDLNWEKFNLYSLVHHSTSIEGSSLTEVETQVLLEEHLTAKGKPYQDHSMVRDNYAALLFILKESKKDTYLSLELIQQCAALVMKNTGGIVNGIMGSFDSSKGEIRKVNVVAGQTRFMDFSKVTNQLNNVINNINTDLEKITDLDNQLITAFDLQFYLLTIHPFADGNGRTSRLMTNFIQHRFSLPLSNIYKEDKQDYYQALIDTRKSNDLNIFRCFMLDQYSKMLKIEIEKVLSAKQENIIEKTMKKNKGRGLSFL